MGRQVLNYNNSRKGSRGIMIRGSNYLWISQYIQIMISLISGDLSRIRMKLFYANIGRGCVCPIINLVCPSVCIKYMQ